MKDEKQYTIGSLFSGIGGIELGFEREGFQTIFFVEKDDYCRAVLKKRFNIYGHKGFQCDVISFGFPCQDISQAGKGEGITGKRSGLWKDGAETIRLLRPKIALIENVPILTKRGLNVVLADIAEMGYDAEWFTISAQEVGAIHVRERLFIIAYSSEFRQIYLRFQEQSSETRKQAQPEIAPIFITDDWKERIQRFKQETVYREQGLSWCKDVRRIEDLRDRQDIPEPLFCGSRDGIPHWMDRIGCCGNAVVPQVSQFIAKRIKEILATTGENFFPSKDIIIAKSNKIKDFTFDSSADGRSFANAKGI